MDSHGVLLPLIHEHHMIPWNDLRKGDCCGCFDTTSDGYYCQSCDFFVHKECGDVFSEVIQHPSHPKHTLQLVLGYVRRTKYLSHWCHFCGMEVEGPFYSCDICLFDLDIFCAKYPPPEVIDNPNTHHHKLTLRKEHNLEFDCGATKCDKIGGFAYECNECDLSFHVECVWHPSELKHPLKLNHSYHPLHPLKLHTCPLPDYSDGKCRLCARKIDTRMFYHCSSCNFTLDMNCVLNPPPQSLLYLKAHDHQLTLLRRLLSFTCNACGLSGDRSPYICVPCDFMIHPYCLDLPRLININRHDHRVSHTSILGVVNSVCRVCYKKVDWTCGGYSCPKCPGYVVHSRCATREDVWNGKELEGVPEVVEDIEPYVVIDDNTIQHFSHREHYLRLHTNGVMCEDKKWCSACSHPISLKSFYSCIDCDFILHQTCAGFPRMKWLVLHNERLTLVTRNGNLFTCNACGRRSNSFRYKHGYYQNFDVLCGSIAEPFFHPSHPDHPLYSTSLGEAQLCNGCNVMKDNVLSCIEENCCRFAVCFKCATLPQVVNHRVDDQPLSLCYGEEATGIYWCDICEKRTDPEIWFYTCKDHRASLHTQCVLGDFSGLMPRSTITSWNAYEVVLNNSISRPFCSKCKLHCIFPIMLMFRPSVEYFCSIDCCGDSSL